MTTTTTAAAAAVPHYRRRALAGLDELIARAEAVRERWQAGGAGRAGVMVGLANERLSMLRSSRLALLTADGQDRKGGVAAEAATPEAK